MSTAASLVSKKKTLKMLPHLPSQLRDLSTKFQQQQKKKNKTLSWKESIRKKKKGSIKNNACIMMRLKHTLFHTVLL